MIFQDSSKIPFICYKNKIIKKSVYSALTHILGCFSHQMCLMNYEWAKPL